MPLTDQITRYRKQRGVNLGSWFVTEKWISSHVYREAADPKISDIDIARGGNAKAIFEEHWDTFIDEGDLAWHAAKGFNSVRLPIGYYHLCSQIPEVLKGTDFEPYHDVFSGAWERIMRVIDMAGRHGLGVLVDLHSAAGSQNGNDHSGISDGRINLWYRQENVTSTDIALDFLATTLKSIPHVVGLELLNEPNNQGPLKGPDLPFYIHDAFKNDEYADFVSTLDDNRDGWVVLDHHLYRTFTDEDRSFTGAQHAVKITKDFTPWFAAQCEKVNGNMVVAEWSACVNYWDENGNEGGRSFVKAQMDLFERQTAGWWFWTIKKDPGNRDPQWRLGDAITDGLVPSSVGTGPFKGVPGQDVKDKELQSAHNSHKDYWKSHGGSPNPESFGPGFAQGWDDAIIFFTSPTGAYGTNELGFIGQWAKERKKEGGVDVGNWEWAHGFKQGVDAAKKVSIG